MIPPILHQISATGREPEPFRAAMASWGLHNPDWTVTLWTDRMLLEFVAAHYPGSLRSYCGYAQPEMRSAAARYFLLDHFGGVFAELGSTCVAPFDSVMSEDRVVLSRDLPSLHRLPGDRQAPIFNGTMAGPAGHPFWRHVLNQLPDPNGAVTPLFDLETRFLTHAIRSYDDTSGLAVHDASLFATIGGNGQPLQPADGGPVLAVRRPPKPVKPERKMQAGWDQLRRGFYLARHRVTRGPSVPEAVQRARVDRSAVEEGASAGDALVILVPLRDATEHIGPFLDVVARLDYPKDRIKLAFCEGDSTDGSWDMIQAATQELKPLYRDIVLTQCHIHLAIDRPKRSRRALQRRRRSALATVRNHLIDAAIDESDDWALWIDIDVWRFQPDIITRLRETGHRIVVPNCVTVPGARSFDLNNFVACHGDDYRYYRHMRDGLHQPPLDGPDRLYLSDFRHREHVALDAVGGTMLLVDAALHRGGLRFPELPYRNLVETEGFGHLARDVGVQPIGLPQLEILHVPW